MPDGASVHPSMGDCGSGVRYARPCDACCPRHLRVRL